MIVNNSLRSSRRARSIEDGSESVGCYLYLHVTISRARPDIVCVYDSKFLATDLTSQGNSSTVGHNGLGLGVGQHILNSFHRMRRIEWYINLARLEYRQNSNQHGRPMIHQNRNWFIAIAASI